MTPKDYPEDETLKPTQVEDPVAENRIKWGNIVGGLILSSIIGATGLGYAFGGHLIKESQEFKDVVTEGLKEINITLKEMQKELGRTNTTTLINETRLNNHDARISRLENE